jgi:hypothetical protein
LGGLGGTQCNLAVVHCRLQHIPIQTVHACLTSMYAPGVCVCCKLLVSHMYALCRKFASQVVYVGHFVSRKNVVSKHQHGLFNHCRYLVPRLPTLHIRSHCQSREQLQSPRLATQLARKNKAKALERMYINRVQQRIRHRYNQARKMAAVMSRLQDPRPTE